ncbi:MAG: hypothetical protein HY584_03815 [Candidatus Omnitrophica bacterium]|nr:hypothetical protein [Candidatus Omnitrophota bacterium]
MSLIYFHIALITVAVIFSLGVGLWEFGAYSDSRKWMDLAAAIVSFLFSLGALIYLVWFVRKKKPTMLSR